MTVSLHFLPQFPQGNLDMPPCCAATDAESNSAGFLPVPAPVKQRSRCQRRRKATFILLLTDSAGFVLLPCSKHK